MLITCVISNFLAAVARSGWWTGDAHCIVPCIFPTTPMKRVTCSIWQT